MTRAHARGLREDRPFAATRPRRGRGGELHDTPGVWVGDTSAFPTAVGVNPMVTCQALARRTAQAILRASGARP